MSQCFPAVRYAAGHLGRGSDVLGFDTSQSRDHDWGPKTTLFLAEADYESHRARIGQTMAAELPMEIDGYATQFDEPGTDGGTLAPVPAPPVNHGVTVTTVGRFSRGYLGVDGSRNVPERAWLAMPSQRLRTVRSGRVFADLDGWLAAFRRQLYWYPDYIWWYRMACAWRRVDQEEPFVARSGDVGDELGSRLVASRQITELMRLAFLQAREYAPYMKWLGTAFSRLEIASVLEPVFRRVMDAHDWRMREAALNEAYVIVGEAHNDLGVTSRVEVEISPFHGRPYLVPHSSRFVKALDGLIPPDRLNRWPAYLGGVDQFADSTDVLDRIDRMHNLASACDDA